MPVHVAGPRLLSSIKFKHLVKGAGSAGAGRSSNVALNLTPFVDMMTILVTFLLMVFSSSGELLKSQPNLDMPEAMSNTALQVAPIIVASRNEIKYVNGDVTASLGSVDAALKDEGAKLDDLYERLEAANKTIQEYVTAGKLPKDLKAACEDRTKRPKPGSACPLGLAILQADLTTDAKLIKKIVLTAKAAGFDNLMFAVKNK